MARRVAVIVGQGRSGTNWLLEMLDLSPSTFCRNEPNECPDSLLHRLAQPPDGEPPDATAFGAQWDAAVESALCHFGDRDHRARVRKRYLRPAAQALGIYRAVHSPRFRAAVRLVLPRFGRSEFAVPGFLRDPSAAADTVGVLKLNMAPGFAGFVLRHRPGVPVLHIVRHPGGFLESWRSRYLAANDAERVLRENRARLAQLACTNTTWAARMPPPETLDVFESELLYWRYANEAIYEIGKTNPDYHFIAFEALASNPLPIMRRVYAACGLELTRETLDAIAKTAAGSQTIAGKWRTALSVPQRALVESTLRETPLPIPNNG